MSTTYITLKDGPTLTTDYTSGEVRDLFATDTAIVEAITFDATGDAVYTQCAVPSDHVRGIRTEVHPWDVQPTV